MSDNLLRYLVWQGIRLYMRHRFAVYRRRAIIAGVGAVAVAGVVAAGRHAASSD